MNNPILETYIQRHDFFLTHLIDNADTPAVRLKEAMHYSLFPGGKRMRPLLVYLCGQLLHVPLDTLDIIGVAIEMVHAYSLVHDDLPAMDNDDFRRGKPSCHKAFDEATAILAGDGLHTFAIDLLLTHLPQHLTSLQTLKITHQLTKAVGISGMLSGQSLDLSMLNHQVVSEAQLSTIHQLKTGKLIDACIQMVLCASEPTAMESQALSHFAMQLSLVFQMQDDYLDSYDTTNALGKGRASDSANHKMTFATCHDRKTLHQRILEHFQLAHETLACFEDRAEALHALIDMLLTRSHAEAVSP